MRSTCRKRAQEPARLRPPREHPPAMEHFPRRSRARTGRSGRSLSSLLLSCMIMPGSARAHPDSKSAGDITTGRQRRRLSYGCAAGWLRVVLDYALHASTGKSPYTVYYPPVPTSRASRLHYTAISDVHAHFVPHSMPVRIIPPFCEQ